jgi:hypothetical protein
VKMGRDNWVSLAVFRLEHRVDNLNLRIHECARM